MNPYMLDTNIISALMREPKGPVTTQIAAVGPDAICVSIITACELRYGCEKKGSAKLTDRVEQILSSIDVLALDTPTDVEYSRIRAELEAAGTPIGPNDLLIAAHARALNAILVTANRTEFERVKGLTVEDWTS